MDYDEEPLKPDRIKSKSSLSLLWEEFFGGPIDLQSYVENCWNSIQMIDIDLEEPNIINNPNDNEQNTEDISRKLHKDSGNCSLNEEDLVKTTDILNSHVVINPIEHDKLFFVLKELIDTESSYYSSLKDVEEGYLDLYSSKFPDCKTDDLKTIFCNWKELRIFHFSFLAELKFASSKGLEGLSKLAQIFKKMAPQFEKLYSEYCVNYIKSVNYLNHLESESSDSWRYLAKCQSDLGHQLPLSTFLLKPVQRILKYQLMLQELIQHCKQLSKTSVHSNSSSNNSIIQQLLQALDAMVTVAARINQRQTNEERTNQINQLARELYQLSLLTSTTNHNLDTSNSWGKCWLCDEMRVVGAKNPRLVLVSDCVVVVAKKLSIAHSITTSNYQYSSSCVQNPRWELKSVIECSSMMLFDYIPKHTLGFHIINSKNPQQKVTFIATNEQQKTEWCNKLKQLITFNNESMCQSFSNKQKSINKKDMKRSMTNKSKYRRKFSMDTESELMTTSTAKINASVVIETAETTTTTVEDNQEDKLLDLESSIRELLELQPITNENYCCEKLPNVNGSTNKQISTHNPSNWRDLSIYQSTSRTNQRLRQTSLDTDSERAASFRSCRNSSIGRDDGDDYSSVTVDVNEELIREYFMDSNDVETQHSTINYKNVQQQTYARYLEISKNKAHLTQQDIEELFHPLHQIRQLNNNNNSHGKLGEDQKAQMAEIEVLDVCSDQEDSIDSDVSFKIDHNSSRRRKTASMDRNAGNSIVKPANHISANGTSNSTSKKSILSTVRNIRNLRSNSDCNNTSHKSASHFNSNTYNDIRPGIVKSLSKLFRVPSNRRDKSVSAIDRHVIHEEDMKLPIQIKSITNQSFKIKPKAPIPPIPTKPPRTQAKVDLENNNNNINGVPVKELVTIFQAEQI